MNFTNNLNEICGILSVYFLLIGMMWVCYKVGKEQEIENELYK